MSRHLSSPENGGIRVNPLDGFNQQLRRQRERNASIGIVDYLDQVGTGKISSPPRNAAQTVVDALTQKKPYVDSAGYQRYPQVSDRTDELAMVGVTRSVAEYMRYLKAEAHMDSNDRIAVVVAPTGAGKTTLNKVLIKELEDYTSKTPTPTVFGIEYCPINEDPLHVLDSPGRERFLEETGIHVTGELCPHCQAQAEENIQGKMTGFLQGNSVPLNMKVKPVNFSRKMQRGIATIEPQTFTQEHAPEFIAQAVLNSNRGILHLAEMGRIDPSYLLVLNNLFRGREFTYRGKPFQLDNLIIGEMTSDEWDVFQQRASLSLLERIDSLHITYPLDPNAELQILEKRIASSKLTVPVHYSPRTLETVALGAVRTRLVPYGEGTKTMDVGEKALFYAGNDIAGFTQADRKNIEQTGLLENEGKHGMSPPAIWGVVSKLIAEQVADYEETGKKGCVDYVELRKRLDFFIDNDSTVSGEYPAVLRAEFKQVTEDYDVWLINTFERAFQDRYVERANNVVHEYLTEVDYVLDPSLPPRVDPRTEEVIPVNMKLIESFEDAVSDQALIHDQTKPNSRRGFRMKMQQAAGKIVKSKQETNHGYDDEVRIDFTEFFSSFPGFEKGIKNYLKESGSYDPKDSLKTLTPDAAQTQLLQSMEQRLISEHGFCECCVSKMRKYVAGLL